MSPTRRLTTLMRRALSLTALAAVLLLPAASAAGGATRFVLKGRGYGHGVGMSQYGAYGYAQHGLTYDQILRHYYTGTTLARAPSRLVRVLLQPVDPYVRVRGATGVAGRGLDRRTTYVVRRFHSLLSVRTASGRLVGRFLSPIRFSRPGHALRLLGPALNHLRDGLYRGGIETMVDGGGVTAINVLPLDLYVQGVVAGEMPFRWHPEALKAQAVTARSYALATDKPGAFDQYPDTRSQVYRGLYGERASTNQAVQATSGLAVAYAGAVATTYYFSTSGGYTENVENSFIGSSPVPYLKAVPDRYDAIAPRHFWRFSFSPRTLGRRLGVPGTLRSVRVLKRGVSPRIIRARFYGTRGSRVLTGPQIRRRLHLYDTWIRFYKISTTASRAARHSGGLLGAAAALALAEGPPAIEGVFEPAPRDRRVRLELLRGGRWRTLKLVRTTRGGRYRVSVSRPGIYRVRAGDVAGPAVRVR